MPLSLRLPEIRPPPSPSEQHKRLICQLDEAPDEVCLPRCFGGARSTSATVGYKERTRSRPRGASLDDFLNEPSNRPARGSRPPRVVRQAIDDEMTVPTDIFESMLRAGQEARGRATHTLSHSDDGRPYLKHHNADAVEAARAESPCPMVVDEIEMELATSSPSPPVPHRLAAGFGPPSCCASELASQNWQGHGTMALQVG